MWLLCPRVVVRCHSQSSFLGWQDVAVPFEDRDMLVSAERILITSLRALLIWLPNWWESCNVDRQMLNREKDRKMWIERQKHTWKRNMTGNELKTSVAKLTDVWVKFIAFFIPITCRASDISGLIHVTTKEKALIPCTVVNNRVSLILRKVGNLHWMCIVLHFTKYLIGVLSLASRQERFVIKRYIGQHKKGWNAHQGKWLMSFSNAGCAPYLTAKKLV